MMKKTYIKSIVLSAWSIALGLVAGTFTSCSEDLQLKTNDLPEGCIEIELNVPEPIEVNTRATDEYTISNLTVFIFNENGTAQLGEKIVVNNVGTSSSLNSKKITLQLPTNIFSVKKQIYAIANPKGQLSNTYASITALEANVASTESSVALGDGLMMTGKTLSAVEANSSSATISMNRIVAKIRATLNGVEGYTLKGLKVFEVADGVFYGAGTNEAYKFYKKNNVYSADKTAETSGSEYTYIYPSKAKSSTGNEPAAYLILKASPSGSSTVYNYCLSLKDKGYDIEPNHDYTIEITQIKHAGFIDEADAIDHPENGWVDYKIHDHAANILSMQTDGLRELGLTYNFDWDKSNTNYITVRWYSPVTSERPTNFTSGSTGMPVLETGTDWLEILWDKVSNDDEISGPDNAKNDEEETDNDASGAITKKFQLKVKDDYTFNRTRTARISVDWMGLRRTMTITYRNEFNPTDVCSATLYIAENSTSNLSYTNGVNSSAIKITNYWDLLKEQGTSASKSGDGSILKLFGVGESGMGSDMLRNEGLHFPMPYGDSYRTNNNNFCRYEYILEFPIGTTISSVNLSGDPENMIEVKRSGDSGVSLTTTQILVRIVRNSFTYWIGSLDINYSNSNNANGSISFNVYHTGFFHFHESGKRSEQYRVGEDLTSVDYGYYYYEIVQMENKKWFDRNLGAKSRGMYIQNADGSSLLGNTWPGNDDACGGYYRVSEYYNKASGTDGTYYDNPETHIYTDLCPPGYRLPRKGEFDDIRLSKTFSTEDISENGLNFYDASYATQNTDNIAGTVYFPKSRYYNNAMLGNSQSGYYWTGSRASGTEKSEIGKWMRGLFISGANTSYIYGDIRNTGMNVRPIYADGTTKDSEFTISFNVKGATNVYLYTYSGIGEERTKTPLEVWPGKGVMDATAAQNGKIVNFSYNTTIDCTNEAVYVVFTYVNNGITKVLCSSGTGLGSTSTEPSEAKGWRVVKGGNYYFNSPQNTSPTKDTANNGWNGIENE